MAAAVAHGLNPTVRLVAAALAAFADDKGECWPSDEALARITGLHPRSHAAPRRKLIEAGLLERVVHGHGRRNRYRLVLSDDGPEAVEKDSTARSAQRGVPETTTRSAQRGIEDGSPRSAQRGVEGSHGWDSAPDSAPTARQDSAPNARCCSATEVSKEVPKEEHTEHPKFDLEQMRRVKGLLNGRHHQ